MRIIAITIVVLFILFMFIVAVTFGVAMGIVLGYETLWKKGGKNDTESDKPKES